MIVLWWTEYHYHGNHTVITVFYSVGSWTTLFWSKGFISVTAPYVALFFMEVLLCCVLSKILPLFLVLDSVYEPCSSALSLKPVYRNWPYVSKNLWLQITCFCFLLSFISSWINTEMEVLNPVLLKLLSVFVHLLSFGWRLRENKCYGSKPLQDYMVLESSGTWPWKNWWSLRQDQESKSNKKNEQSVPVPFSLIGFQTLTCASLTIHVKRLWCDSTLEVTQRYFLTSLF